MKSNTAHQLLRELVQIPSFVGKGNKLCEIGVVNFLVDYFNKDIHGFKKLTIPFDGNRSNLLFKSSKKVDILFACHMDTVPPSNRAMLKLKITDDRAYGLGTKDMKGGIVSTLLALKRLDRVPKGIGVLFYGDEETTFKGIVATTKEAKKLFPGGVKMIISPESKFSLGIGARGIIVVDVRVYGKRAHSARPNLGVDAVKCFVKSVELVEHIVNKHPSSLGLTTLTIPRMNAGLLQPDGSVGVHVGTVPDYAEATISVRNADPQLSAQKLIELLHNQSSLLGLRLECVVREDYPARITAKKAVNRLSRLVIQAGHKVEVSDPKTAGFNDVVILGKKLDAPVVNFGPFGEGNHTSEEWVSIASIDATADVFTKIILDYTH